MARAVASHKVKHEKLLSIFEMYHAPGARESQQHAKTLPYAKYGGEPESALRIQLHGLKADIWAILCFRGFDGLQVHFKKFGNPNFDTAVR